MPNQAEANLSALIESTEDLIWSVDLDYRLITFNRALQRHIQSMFGVRPAAGMLPKDLVPPERVGFMPPLYAHALVEGSFREEFSLADGRTLELAFNPIVVDGKAIGVSVFGKDITERKATEESRHFLAEVVESCEEAIITHARSGAILTWNHGAEAIYGYSADEAIGKPFSMIIAPERRARADLVIGQLLAGAPLMQDDGLALRKDGNKVYVTVTTWPIRNSAGEVTAVCTIVRDVSVRHEAEKTRALLASIVESSSDAVHAVNLDGTVVSWNRGAETLFGYTNDEIIGRNIAMLAPAGRSQEVPPFMAVIAQGGLIGSFDTFLRSKDGRDIDVSLSISPIRNSDGKVVGAAAIARDIRQRKLAERALQEAEKKYRDIFEGALEGICQVSSEGKFLAANLSLARMLGYDSPDELISMARDLAQDVWANPNERLLYLRHLEEHGSAHGFECQFKRKDGRHIWASLNDRCVYGTDGRLLYLEGFMEDITERKLAEAALRESLDSLKESQAIGGLGSYILDIGTGGWTSSDVLDEIFGIGKENEHTLAGWTALIHPDDRAMMAAYLAEEVVGKGQNFNKEYRIVRQNDHAERWIHGIGRLEFDAPGQPVKMRGVIKDITESKLSEMQLCDSEERYRTTFEQAAVGIAHTSLEGRYLRCNNRFAEIVGYPIEEVPGLKFEQVTVPEDIAETAEAHQRMLEAKVDSVSIEKRYLRKDGSRTWARLTISPQRDGEGRLLHLLAFVEDISDRKAAEEHLAAAMEALRLSEERYRLAFQINFDSIDICRLEDGKFIDVNDAFIRITGYKREEVIGRTAPEVGIWANPADREKLLERMRLNSVCRNLETQYRTKDGTLRWGLLSVSAFEMNGVPSILSFTRDITDDKEAAERLAKIREALRVSEQRYHTVFQTSLDAISINRIDDGSFIDCNKAFLDTLGYERDEVIGRTSQELGIWADERDRQAMRSMLQQNSSFRGLEVQFRKKNRELIWGEMSASLMEVDGVACILTLTRDITTAKAAEKTIRSLAFYDSLTGLPNRRQLLERLRQPPAAGGQRGSSMALLLVDLDHFKIFNDTLGHQTGDLLLKEVARRVAASVHEGDTVCRLGGDEFVVMIENLSNVAEEAAAQAKAVGEHVLAAIDRPYSIENREYLLTASIGITVFGSHQKSVDDVLQQADIAMDQAKAAGRNTLRFFSPALQTAVNARAAMEVELRQAIKTNQFQLYYQPQVERGRVTGAEALIRWNHPTRGLVMPDDFISVAEESRLILPMGNWVLETACEQIAAWADRTQTSSLSIAVNISALQFRQPEFVQQVLSALSRTGANPKNLRLELTESMLVEDIEEVIAKMTELRSHGLRFSLDDFGTGYSSLAYLKRLSLDRLKIDRSFVRDILADSTSRAIAQTIISLGKAMGLSVIAEGVETEEQRSLLTALGCHSFQGFLFSHPLPLDQFHAFLKGFAKSKNPR